MMNTEINLLKNGGDKKQFNQEFSHLAIYHELNFLRPNRSAKNHTKLFFRIGLAMMLIGILGIGTPFAINSISLRTLETQDSLAKVETSVTNQTAAVATSKKTNSTAVSQKYLKQSLPAVKNRLTMPEIGLDMPIFASTDPNTLWKGGWLFGSTPDIGSNSVIFGHRYRYLPPVTNTFYSLNKIKVGDKFTINWQGKDYHYTVTQTKIVSPNDLSVIAPSNKSIATLITCTPLFTSINRLVIIGELDS